MTSKRFTILVLTLTLALTASIAALNVYMDEFGIYGNAKGKNIRIWTYNRATKYLLSLNYIPANFDGILIGSSSSAVAMDTRKIKNHAIYNLSINGGNICEVAPAAINAIKSGKMRNVIICLDPYLTKNSMMKTNELSPKLEQSVLGSIFTIKFYFYKLKNTLFPSQDPYRKSWAGHRLPDTPTPPSPGQNTPHKRQQLVVDPKAITCLKGILHLARKHNVHISAYFYPKPYDIFETNAKAYRAYQKIMRSLFSNKDTVWEFNTPQFDTLTKSPASFYDRGHLSTQGGNLVLKEIERRLD